MALGSNQNSFDKTHLELLKKIFNKLKEILPEDELRALINEASMIIPITMKQVVDDDPTTKKQPTIDKLTKIKNDTLKLIMCYGLNRPACKIKD